jgi:hypothetical protein
MCGSKFCSMKIAQEVGEYAAMLGDGVDLRHRGRHTAEVCRVRQRGVEVYLPADVMAGEPAKVEAGETVAAD